MEITNIISMTNLLFKLNMKQYFIQVAKQSIVAVATFAFIAFVTISILSMYKLVEYQEHCQVAGRYIHVLEQTLEQNDISLDDTVGSTDEYVDYYYY